MGIEVGMQLGVPKPRHRVMRIPTLTPLPPAAGFRGRDNCLTAFHDVGPLPGPRLWVR